MIATKDSNKNRYGQYKTEWCPCGCGRRVSKEESRYMKDKNITHTTTKAVVR